MNAKKIRKLFLELAEAFAEVDTSSAGSEWIEQAASPLGRRAHLRLAKSGKVTVARVGRKVLIRRSDLEAYFKAETAKVIDDDVRAEQLVKGWKKSA